MFINKLINGNYYELDVNRIVYLFQLRKVDSTRIYIESYYIANGVYMLSDMSLSFINDNDRDCFEYRSITFKDILKYLPDNHPDRLSYYRKQKINHLLNEN